MTRLLLALLGWLTAALLAWYASRQYGQGFEEGREDLYSELGIAL